MALPDLSKLALDDAAYKRLTPEELMKYNKQLPTLDYENPYQHQEFPKVMYSVRQNADGSKRLVSAQVNSQAQVDELGAEWAESPADFGIETAPGAPVIKIDEGFGMDIPAPSAEPPPEPQMPAKRGPGRPPKAKHVAAGA